MLAKIRHPDALCGDPRRLLFSACPKREANLSCKAMASLGLRKGNSNCPPHGGGTERLEEEPKAPRLGACQGP